jgi:preprotein translocase subunit YajC
MMNYILMAQQQGTTPNPWMSFLPLILIIVIFYLFMIRPQVKRQKEIRKFRENLQKGDNVVTTGGIYGKIVEVKENTIILQVDSNVQIKVDKNGIVKDMGDATQR